MRLYWTKTKSWHKRLYPKGLVWSIKEENSNSVYLTFDDGPHPIATPFVLDLLAQYQAKATFFCIGKNVLLEPEIFQRIQQEGHSIGNHTQQHLNAWKVSNKKYLNDVIVAKINIQSTLFRPPYGKIKSPLANSLMHGKQPMKIIMWDVLSGDFDPEISKEQCWENVSKNIEPGSIVVFHDSQKAFEKLSFVLPKVLEFCQAKNLVCKAIPNYL